MIIPRSVLCIHRFSDCPHPRYRLDGIRVERRANQATVAATNGRVAARISWSILQIAGDEPAQDFTTLLPYELLQDLDHQFDPDAPAREVGGACEIRVGDDGQTVICLSQHFYEYDLSATFEPLVGRFPDVGSCFEPFEQSPPIGAIPLDVLRWASDWFAQLAASNVEILANPDVLLLRARGGLVLSPPGAIGPVQRSDFVAEVIGMMNAQDVGPVEPLRVFSFPESNPGA